MAKPVLAHLADPNRNLHSDTNPLAVRPFPVDDVIIQGQATIEVTSSSVVSLSNLPTTARGALISVDGGNIRMWPTGQNPTPSSGLRLGDTAMFYLDTRRQLENFRVIAEAVTVTLYVAYFEKAS
jgi:hypothetical protein